MSRSSAFSLFAVLAALASAPVRTAASPVPPAAQTRVPTAAEHTEYVVEVNKKGQVTRVRSGKPSRDAAFNAMTYGNALQVYIRTPGGGAVSGTYRLTYDYDPKTHDVRRTVGLMHAGGVDPNALGAVDAMAAINRRRASRQPPEEQRTTAGAPTPSSTLPDLGTITGHKH